MLTHFLPVMLPSQVGLITSRVSVDKISYPQPSLVPRTIRKLVGVHTGAYEYEPPGSNTQGDWVVMDVTGLPFSQSLWPLIKVID